MTASRPFIVGLIGGIACGKSTVARMLQARGGLWLDSDRMAHDVLNSAEVKELVAARFGNEVLSESGDVDRKQLAAHVFGPDPHSLAHLKWLEQTIHPRVRARTREQIAAMKPPHQFAIIDAPLLLEAGWGPECNRILFIDTPLALRQSWAAARGWSPDELAKREARQLALGEKRQRATDVIHNDGTLAELEKQVEQFTRSIEF